jgi:hypothetical protein
MGARRAIEAFLPDCFQAKPITGGYLSVAQREKRAALRRAFLNFNDLVTAAPKAPFPNGSQW